MQYPLNIFKKEQKERTKVIKDGKKKDDDNHYKRWEYRHHHIAYCELRGTSRDRIEQPREGNEPNEKWIDQIKSEWLSKIEKWRKHHEALRSN